MLSKLFYEENLKKSQLKENLDQRYYNFKHVNKERH